MLPLYIYSLYCVTGRLRVRFGFDRPCWTSRVKRDLEESYTGMYAGMGWSHMSIAWFAVGSASDWHMRFRGSDRELEAERLPFSFDVTCMLKYHELFVSYRLQCTPAVPYPLMCNPLLPLELVCVRTESLLSPASLPRPRPFRSPQR